MTDEPDTPPDTEPEATSEGNPEPQIETEGGPDPEPESKEHMRARASHCWQEVKESLDRHGCQVRLFLKQEDVGTSGAVISTPQFAIVAT